jgi:hypothetical protein
MDPELPSTHHPQFLHLHIFSSRIRTSSVPKSSNTHSPLPTYPHHVGIHPDARPRPRIRLHHRLPQRPLPRDQSRIRPRSKLFDPTVPGHHAQGLAAPSARALDTPPGRRHHAGTCHLGAGGHDAGVQGSGDQSILVKRDRGSRADMIDLIEAEVQGQWMRAGPGKVEMLVRGLAVAELKKFFENL